MLVSSNKRSFFFVHCENKKKFHFIWNHCQFNAWRVTQFVFLKKSNKKIYNIKKCRIYLAGTLFQKNIALHINVPLVIATIIYFIQVSHPQKHNRINLYFCVTFSLLNFYVLFYFPMENGTCLTFQTSLNESFGLKI